MTTADKLFEILRTLLLQLPSLITMFACIVFAIVRWKRHPKVSLTLIISLVLMIAVSVAFAFIYEFVPDLFRKPGDLGSTQTVFMVISFFYNSLWAVALAILLAAIFMQRRRAGSVG